jgi:hypothetical protein
MGIRTAFDRANFIYCKEHAYREEMNNRHMDLIITVGSFEGKDEAETCIYNVRKNTFTGRTGGTRDSDYIQRLLRHCWNGDALTRDDMKCNDRFVA